MRKKQIRTIGIVAIVAAAAMIGSGLYLVMKPDDTISPQTSSGIQQINQEMDSATACQTLLTDYYKAIFSKDSTALYKMMAPSEYWSYYMDHYQKAETDIVDTYADAINNTLASWEAACGSDAKVSFQIEASTEQSVDFLSEWSNSMNEIIGEDVLQAQEAITLEVTQTITGSAGSQEVTIHPTLIKVNDQWYILDEGTSTSDGSAQS